MSSSFSRAAFLKGATQLSQLPPDVGVEVAFAGRSNAGKSSAINKLVGQKALARTSKTPGRTREINFFVVDEPRRLVDLPGYGYAKVAKSIKQHWGALLEDYLMSRRSLQGVVVMMDIRRPFTELDDQLVNWCLEAQLPVHGLLTKRDKLSRGKALETLNAARKRIEPIGDRVTLQLFSALKSIGVDEARQRVSDWLADEDEDEDAYAPKV